MGLNTNSVNKFYTGCQTILQNLINTVNSTGKIKDSVISFHSTGLQENDMNCRDSVEVYYILDSGRRGVITMYQDLEDDYKFISLRILNGKLDVSPEEDFIKNGKWKEITCRKLLKQHYGIEPRK